MKESIKDLIDIGKRISYLIMAMILLTVSLPLAIFFIAIGMIYGVVNFIKEGVKS